MCKGSIRMQHRFTKIIIIFYMLGIWAYTANVWKALQVSFPKQLESHQSGFFYKESHDEMLWVAYGWTTSVGHHTISGTANFDFWTIDFLWKQRKLCKFCAKNRRSKTQNQPLPILVPNNWFCSDFIFLLEIVFFWIKICTQLYKGLFR